jgi:hypothetical protein
MSIQEYIAVNVFFKNQEAPDYGKNYWEKGGGRKGVAQDVPTQSKTGAYLKVLTLYTVYASA